MSVAALFAAAPPSALVVLIKLTENILASPDEPKFRTVKRTNKTIATKVLSCPAGEALLGRLGFRGEGEVLTTQATPAVLAPVRDALARALARVVRVCAGFGWVVHGLALEVRVTAQRHAIAAGQ